MWPLLRLLRRHVLLCVTRHELVDDAAVLTMRGHCSCFCTTICRVAIIVESCSSIRCRGLCSRGGLERIGGILGKFIATHAHGASHERLGCGRRAQTLYLVSIVIRLRVFGFLFLLAAQLWCASA